MDNTVKKDEDQKQDKKTLKMSRQERIAKEKELLISKLAASNLKEIRSRVAFILNHYPETRNSDIILAYKYWQTFQPEHLLSDGSINQSKMFKLERQISIIRARAKIQNEYGLFLADEEVRKRRFGLEEREKEEQIADKPGVPSSTFYLDESGKTQKYIIVGGLCFTDSRSILKMTQHLVNWRIANKIKYEFHFTEMRTSNLETHIQFFTEALGFSDSSSFKAIALSQTNIKGRKVDDIVRELYYQLIHQGMEQENKTGRVSFPRTVSIFKDKEDGSNLFMISLGQELKSGFTKHFGDNLSLSLLEEVDSKGNPLIQLADLYIGSISRILNREANAEQTHKDEFAQFVVDLLRLNLDGEQEAKQDSAFVKIF